MKAIFKRDFKAYFTSPIGFVYVGAFILVMNAVFWINNALSGVSSLSGVFGFMLTVIMFSTPILTMRIFSEDFKQKTDQLLFTAPVKLGGIVLGKFFSALAVFVLLLVLTLTWPLIIAIFGENNIPELVGNYIAILLVGAAYIAMGVFISSLTENQVVAAIGTLGLFLGLLLLEEIGIAFSSGGALPGFVVEILQFMGIFGRFSYISVGILSLADLVFYASICAVFLYLTVRVLERRKW